MSNRASRLLLMLIMVLAAPLVLAGCGDDDSESGSDSRTDAAATTDDTATDTSDDAAMDTGDGAMAEGHSMTLTATVGPGFDIMLQDSGGNDVTTLPAGDYTIMVADKSGDHNFHLMGDGVDEMTTVEEETETTWNVTLGAGEYSFQCDPHASSMNGSFTVT